MRLCKGTGLQGGKGRHVRRARCLNAQGLHSHAKWKLDSVECAKMEEDMIYQVLDGLSIVAALGVIIAVLTCGNLLDRDSPLWRALTGPARAFAKDRRRESPHRR
jgi:hypothetical protein